MTKAIDLHEFLFNEIRKISAQSGDPLSSAPWESYSTWNKDGKTINLYYIGTERLSEQLASMFPYSRQQYEDLERRLTLQVNSAYASMRTDNDARRKAEAALAEANTKIGRLELERLDLQKALQTAALGTGR